MKMSIIGTGYVGLVSGLGWAALGHDITCIDIDDEKVNAINGGIAPIFEIGIKERLSKALEQGNFRSSSKFEDMQSSEIIFISVGTPSMKDGSVDLRYIRSAANSIEKELGGTANFPIVVVRSTVPPGTTENIVENEIAKNGKRKGHDFGLAMIPEFLKEGSAFEDFEKPDRIIIGCSDEKTAQVLKKLHETFDCPKRFVGIKTAEMIKYVSNSMLAARISFTNEIADICKENGLDVDQVMEGVGLDSRIGPKFLDAGPGFGGSCFPKDVMGLVHFAKESGSEVQLLESVLSVNKKQKTKLVDMASEEMDLKGKTIAILGLAFKPNTDDIRESAAISSIKVLLEKGAHVKAFDPEAMDNMKKIFPTITYAGGIEECLERVDAAFILAAWPQFKKSAHEYKRMLGEALLFDSRRIIKQEEAEKAGLKYFCIGRG